MSGRLLLFSLGRDIRSLHAAQYRLIHSSRKGVAAQSPQRVSRRETYKFYPLSQSFSVRTSSRPWSKYVQPLRTNRNTTRGEQRETTVKWEKLQPFYVLTKKVWTDVGNQWGPGYKGHGIYSVAPRPDPVEV